MDAQNDSQWRQLVRGLRDGDPSSAQEFWDRFGPALYRLAEGKLNPRLRRRVSPEDVAQSACRTFLRRAKLGQFTLPDNEALWHLLCAITLNKAREQMRYHGRQKRGLDQEIQAEDTESQDGLDAQVAGTDPTPAEAAEFADTFEKLLSSLDEEERQVVDLVLQDHTQPEIAEQLGTSERTVRRIFQRVKTALTRLLAEDES